MVDFAFLEAIHKAKTNGYQNVAARLPDGKWLVVAIEELNQAARLANAGPWGSDSG